MVRRRRVAIIGASRDPNKYGHRAVRAYAQSGWTVYPVNPAAAEANEPIAGHRAVASLAQLPRPLHRVSLYLPPEQGLTILHEVAEAKPDEFYVNPGAESPELIKRARSLGLRPVVACSILAVGMTPDEV